MQLKGVGGTQAGVSWTGQGSSQQARHRGPGDRDRGSLATDPGNHGRVLRRAVIWFGLLFFAPVCTLKAWCPDSFL